MRFIFWLLVMVSTQTMAEDYSYQKLVDHNLKRAEKLDPIQKNKLIRSLNTYEKWSMSILGQKNDNGMPAKKVQVILDCLEESATPTLQLQNHPSSYSTRMSAEVGCIF